MTEIQTLKTLGAQFHTWEIGSVDGNISNGTICDINDFSDVDSQQSETEKQNNKDNNESEDDEEESKVEKIVAKVLDSSAILAMQKLLNDQLEEKEILFRNRLEYCRNTLAASSVFNFIVNDDKAPQNQPIQYQKRRLSVTETEIGKKFDDALTKVINPVESIEESKNMETVAVNENTGIVSRSAILSTDAQQKPTLLRSSSKAESKEKLVDRVRFAVNNNNKSNINNNSGHNNNNSHNNNSGHNNNIEDEVAKEAVIVKQQAPTPQQRKKTSLLQTATHSAIDGHAIVTGSGLTRYGTRIVTKQKTRKVKSSGADNNNNSTTTTINSEADSNNALLAEAAIVETVGGNSNNNVTSTINVNIENFKNMELDDYSIKITKQQEHPNAFLKKDYLNMREVVGETVSSESKQVISMSVNAKQDDRSYEENNDDDDNNDDDEALIIIRKAAGEAAIGKYKEGEHLLSTELLREQYRYSNNDVFRSITPVRDVMKVRSPERNDNDDDNNLLRRDGIAVGCSSSSSRYNYDDVEELEDDDDDEDEGDDEDDNAGEEQVREERKDGGMVAEAAVDKNHYDRRRKMEIAAAALNSDDEDEEEEKKQERLMYRHYKNKEEDEKEYEDMRGTIVSSNDKYGHSDGSTRFNMLNQQYLSSPALLQKLDTGDGDATPAAVAVASISCYTGYDARPVKRGSTAPSSSSSSTNNDSNNGTRIDHTDNDDSTAREQSPNQQIEQSSSNGSITINTTASTAEITFSNNTPRTPSTSFSARGSNSSSSSCSVVRARVTDMVLPSPPPPAQYKHQKLLVPSISNSSNIANKNMNSSDTTNNSSFNTKPAMRFRIPESARSAINYNTISDGNNVSSGNEQQLTATALEKEVQRIASITVISNNIVPLVSPRRDAYQHK